MAGSPDDFESTRGPSRRAAALWQLDTGYACGGLIVDAHGRVVEAAPIFWWTVGRRLGDVSRMRCVRKLVRAG